jgi:GTP cyclohydrolase I
MADKIEKVNDGSGMVEDGYNKIETWNTANIEELSSIYYRVLQLIGEDPEREGLVRTPLRVAKALHFLTNGYNMNAEHILKSAMFKEEYRQMVFEKTLISIQCVNIICFHSSVKLTWHIFPMVI